MSEENKKHNEENRFGHNLFDELSSYVGKYVHIELNFKSK